MRKRLWYRTSALAGLLASGVALCAPAAADVFVIVHPSNPMQRMTQREAVDLFMGRSRAFPGGDFALAFDLPKSSPERAEFYQLLTGMNPAQVNSYWSRLMFSGQTMPPQALPNEAAMHDVVRRNPSAIGYLTHDPAGDKELRVVLVLKEAK